MCPEKRGGHFPGARWGAVCGSALHTAEGLPVTAAAHSPNGTELKLPFSRVIPVPSHRSIQSTCRRSGGCDTMSPQNRLLDGGANREDGWQNSLWRTCVLPNQQSGDEIKL